MISRLICSAWRDLSDCIGRWAVETAALYGETSQGAKQSYEDGRCSFVVYAVHIAYSAAC